MRGLRADCTGMDFAVAIATLGAAAIAVLPRLPGFTADDRRREQIRRDVELWRALPASKARKRLGEQIRKATDDLVDERERPLGFDGVLRVLIRWCAVTWLALVVAQSLTVEAQWAVYVRQAALMTGLATGAIAAFLFVASVVLAVQRAGAAWKRRRAERTPEPELEPTATAPITEGSA